MMSPLNRRVLKNKFMLFSFLIILLGSTICFANTNGHEGTPTLQMRKFIPTDEWQEIHDYHIVPQGLHYRMDFATGIKMAKKMNHDNGKQSGNMKDGSIVNKGADDGKTLESVKSDSDKAVVFSKESETNQEITETKPEESHSHSKEKKPIQQDSLVLVSPLIKLEGISNKETNGHSWEITTSGLNLKQTANDVSFQEFNHTLDENHITSETPHDPVDSLASTLAALPQPPKIENLTIEEARKILSTTEFKKKVAKLWLDRQKVLFEATQNIQDHIALMRKLIDNILQDDIPVQSTVNTLHLLEAEVEDLDKAGDFHKLGGFAVISNLLTSSSYKIRSAAAWVLGTAVQNYHTAQDWALDSGALPRLLNCLNVDHKISPQVEKMQKKCLYALSAIVRSNKRAQSLLLKSNGLDTLYALALDHSVPKLQFKVVALVGDLLVEAKDVSEEDVVSSEIKQILTAPKWCQVVPSLLVHPDNDMRVKVLETIQSQIPACLDHFRSNELWVKIEQLKELWTDASQDIDPEYRQELLQLLSAVETSLVSLNGISSAIM